MTIAKKHNLKVIEDCAQSYLCYYKGRLTGTIGDIGCFSLNDYKHISAGDGGMLILNDENMYHKALRFADKNYNRYAKNQAELRKVDYIAPNYRMNELTGAVAIAQLGRLEDLCEKRNIYGEKLSKRIEGLPGIKIPKIEEGVKSSYWFYMFRIDEEEAGVSRDEFSKALNAEGATNWPGYIQSCVYEYSIFLNKTAYLGTDCPFNCKHYSKEINYYKGMCPTAEAINHTAIRMPVSEFFTDKDCEEVIEAIRKVSSYYFSNKKSNKK